MSQLVHPYNVVKDFETALCEYTGARYAVSMTSCTMALLLACKWCRVHPCYEFGDTVTIPKRTYVSVPQSIMHAGFKVAFRDEDWLGAYQLDPLPVWDCARKFTSKMHIQGQFECVSFHATKILGDTQGGAILHDDPVADQWFRRARFDGRTEGVPPSEDNFQQLGFHCYLSPDVAARLLFKLSVLPRDNKPLPNDNYPDLSKIEIFQQV